MTKRLLLAALTSLSLFAQGPGRGIPNLTEQQTAALDRMTAELAPLAQSVTTLRTALTAVAFADPRNGSAIQGKAEELGAAELALANARAVAFAKIQASSDKLAANQVTALIAAGGAFRGAQGGRGAPGGGGGRGTIPNIRQAQTTALTQLTTDVLPLTRELTRARSALTAAAFDEPRNEAAIRGDVEAVKKAELAVAYARADAFAKIQASTNKLSPDQVAVFLTMGGTFAGLGFTQPEALNFAEHEGYISLFDGVSLKGWDGMGIRSSGARRAGRSSVNPPCRTRAVTPIWFIAAWRPGISRSSSK
jgi:hypothetical protein